MLDLMHLSKGEPLYSFQEIQFEDADEDQIVIDVANGKKEMSFVLDSETGDNNVRYEKSGGTESFLNRIWYLGSNRKISRVQERGNPQSLKLGYGNRYLAYLLSLGRERKVRIDPNRSIQEDNGYLSNQVNHWLEFILPGNSVYSYPSGDDNLMTLAFGKGNRRHKSNVGFGVSFILPIIVAGLIAKKGDILIVENPELHLHPKAQSNFMYFFAKVASSGVQVVIETHSDHIVNGMKKTIVDPQCEMSAENGKIYFFGSDNIPVEIKFNQKAEFSEWPDDFMEQAELDLFDIRRMRR